MKGKLGLFFGSFDPIHNGHIDVACFSAQYGFKVRVVPAYSNLWKNTQTSYEDRVEMCKIAFRGADNVSISDIESAMADYHELEKVPTYMVLEYLSQWHDIVIITTKETYAEVIKWEKGEWIINNFKFLIMQMKTDTHSSDIRNLIKENKDVSNLIPYRIKNYIKKKNLYE